MPATTELTPALLDLMEHEKVIEQGLTSFVDVGCALLAIKAQRKYRAAGYKSFDDYCRERWDFDRTYGHRLIVAATIVETLPRGNTPEPTSEKQVRPLAALPQAERAEAWTEAVERANGEQPTAAEVAEVVERRKPQAVPKPAPKVDGQRVEGASPHPAVYSDAVLDAFRDLLRLHDRGDIGDTILDPFAGTGRIHELHQHGYVTIGVELEPEWADLHPDTICGDSTMLEELLIDRTPVDVIATSPAYGNRLADSYNAYDPESRRSYSIDLGRDLSPGSGAALQWGADYRYLHEAVWAQCERVLRPGGLFLLNCKDHRRVHEIAYVTSWHVHELIALGLRWIDARSVPPSGLPHTTAARLPELVVAFRKEKP